jgi:hypothetical protein
LGQCWWSRSPFLATQNVPHHRSLPRPSDHQCPEGLINCINLLSKGALPRGTDCHGRTIWLWCQRWASHCTGGFHEQQRIGQCQECRHYSRPIRKEMIGKWG